jgi:hypothetical protein
MRMATLVGGPLGCAAVAWLAGLACGGEVALNGLAPVDGGAPGLANEAANETGAMTQPVPEGSTIESPEGGDVEDDAQPANCGPTNCHGCCDETGYCETGDQSQACGAGGGACQACAGGNQSAFVCSGGVCSSSCSPSTCAGCCDLQGRCEGGESIAACGAGGRACQPCTTDECVRGICTMQLPLAPCVVSSCPACIPVYQAACCKADDTCGCAVLFPDAGGVCE